MLPPSSHTTGRTVRYPAVPVDCAEPISAAASLVSCVVSPGVVMGTAISFGTSGPYLHRWLPCRHGTSAPSAQRAHVTIRSSQVRSFTAPVSAATTTSAAICQPIPTPYGAGSTRQADRLPRVIRATFPAYTRRIYVLTFRMVSGFESFGPLAQMGPPISAGCSSDRSFAYSFLQIPPPDGHPCCSASSSHHQGLQRTCTAKSTK